MARLRKEGRAWWFVFVNASNVVVNIALNVFFIWYCMRKYNAGESNALIDAVYDPSLGVGYVFLANVASSASGRTSEARSGGRRFIGVAKPPGTRRAGRALRRKRQDREREADRRSSRRRTRRVGRRGSVSYTV